MHQNRLTQLRDQLGTILAEIEADYTTLMAPYDPPIRNRESGEDYLSELAFACEAIDDARNALTRALNHGE